MEKLQTSSLNNKRFNHNLINLRELNTENMNYGRGYVVDENTTYPSITTILSAESSSHIEEWRNKIGHAEADKITRRAGNKGTAVHEMCELYIKNQLEDISNYSITYQENFNKIKPILNSRIDNILAQECPLFSHKYKVAGRVDLIAEFDKILSVIDFKTSNKKKEEDWILNYFTQETAYCLMFEEITGRRIDQIVTIITVEDDEPQIFIKNPRDYFSNFIRVRRNFFNLHGV